MTFIYWLIAGALIGWVGSMLTGRGERVGCLTYIIVGEIGAVLGGLIGLAFGSSILMALIVSIVAIGLYSRLFETQPA
ncbi:MAG: GlsB/YeaQ/YmgE family stress response membrane protein [Caldilineaceae bacterium]|nr:GlsB/YeaQ/YmgE family stress response membrane protein [Caldilineaceae bacterium]MCB0138986.1 GlsB/YeaQ/YmgE family stress response membrane protein [Caldilineaceae bacterium]